MRDYFTLTKPGIIFGNAITAVAGFFLAARGHFNPVLFAAMLLGTGLIIASACVFNNVMDREADKKMGRTKKRALVVGSISVKDALVFGSMLGIAGIGALLFTNLLTLATGLIGWFVYLAIYTPLKKSSVYGTLVGSIAGAMPPVAGYTAVTNSLDTTALLLFLILVFWQMAHFYSIAVYRLSDYSAAKIPVLPVIRGVKITKFHIFFYVLAFIVAIFSLTISGKTGVLHLTVMGILGLVWFIMAVQGFRSGNDVLWARKMFQFSLVVILVWSLLLSVNVALP